MVTQVWCRVGSARRMQPLNDVSVGGKSSVVERRGYGVDGRAKAIKRSQKRDESFKRF